MKNRMLIFIVLLIATTGYCQSRFNPYVSQQPVEAMREVGIYKQRLSETRSNWIQQEIYRLMNLNNSLFDENKLPVDFGTSNHKLKLRKVLTDYLDTIKYYDFTHDGVFSRIQSSFEEIEQYYYDYYNSAVEYYNARNNAKNGYR